MHARVAIYQCLPGHVDDALTVMRDTVAPTMRKQAGFTDILLLAESDTGRLLSISIWESEEAMHRGEREGGYFQDALVRLSPHFVVSPVIEHYDVAARA